MFSAWADISAGCPPKTGTIGERSSEQAPHLTTEDQLTPLSPRHSQTEPGEEKSSIGRLPKCGVPPSYRRAFGPEFYVEVKRLFVEAYDRVTVQLEEMRQHSFQIPDLDCQKPSLSPSVSSQGDDLKHAEPSSDGPQES
jgi:hypothetical protein